MNSNIQKLLTASFLGKVVYAASNLIILPLLVNLLGVESVGLIGFYTTILMLFMVLEGGLTSSLIHDLTGISDKNTKDMLLYINTYVAAFVGIALVITVLISFFSGFVTKYWLEFDGLSSEQVELSIVWMAASIGLNVLMLIFHGVLIAREMHVFMNMAYVIYSILRTFAVFSILFFNIISSSIENYFFLQFCVLFIYVCTLVWRCYKSYGWSAVKILPKIRIILRAIPYGANVMLISITSVVVVQLDKLYLSANLSLSEFSVYAIAASLAGVPYMFSSALHTVLFPRFSRCYGLGDEVAIKKLFESAFLVFACLLLILCSVFWGFSSLFLGVFFEQGLLDDMSVIFRILLIGTAMQALLSIPYALQLAAKWTAVSLNINVVAIPFILIMVPMFFFYWGAEGVAWVWFIYNLASILVTLILVKKRFAFLSGTYAKVIRTVFYMLCMFLPVLAVSAIVILPLLPDTMKITYLLGVSGLFFYMILLKSRILVPYWRSENV